MKKYIDADELYERLNDYALQEAPNDADDADIRMISREVYNAINNCANIVFKMPAVDAEPVSVWKERVNKALAEIKEIRLCDILHGHGACGGCGDDDWVCIASKIENIVSKMDGGSE